VLTFSVGSVKEFGFKISLKVLFIFNCIVDVDEAV